MRGTITEDIQSAAKSFLGENIDTEELRFYPYIDYCLKNGGKIDVNKMSLGEIGLLNHYCIKGYMELKDDSKIFISKPFYQYIQEILWLSYVENKVENNE